MEALLRDLKSLAARREGSNPSLGTRGISQSGTTRSVGLCCFGTREPSNPPSKTLSRKC